MNGNVVDSVNQNIRGLTINNTDVRTKITYLHLCQLVSICCSVSNWGIFESAADKPIPEEYVNILYWYPL